jgi:ABC-type antimicrobial peptide transport system permease subunit
MFALRTSSATPESQANGVRDAIAGIDRQIPVFDIQSLERRVAKSLNLRRTLVLLSLGFGGIALLLSALGIYGVLAYQVTQRRKEIGIRLALGCGRARIFDLVLREGLTLVTFGFVLGLLGAAAVRDSIEILSFRVKATDPTVLVGAIGLLGAVAITACLLPAHRATRIDPVLILSE